MKMAASEAYALEAVGALQEGEFRIARSGKAFRALIDGLYADKPQSIARELSANAFDSHQRAGQTEPFYIHVPCVERAEFFIRDYGIGMSHETVMNLYSTMFESDKIATNDEVGMFGLGSKTPFAYTDQFFLSCYDGETVRQYVAAIGDDGVPRIILMDTSASDEPRGVRVGFSVEEQDFSTFHHAVIQIALGYDPLFESNIDLSAYKLPEPAFVGADWKAYRMSRFERRNLSVWNVRQGCVIYPVEEVSGVQPVADDRYTYIFDAPIGKVSVTTSRERVEYKPDTVAFLKKRMEEIQKEVADQVWDQIKDIRPVLAFFNKAAEIRPSWIRTEHAHPVTGLTRPQITLEGLQCFFHARDDNYSERWTYHASRQISLQASWPDILVLDDVTPFLDPERAEEGNDAPTTFTKTEHRRFARYVRSYAKQEGLAEVVLAIGVNAWNDDFWACAFPKTARKVITFDQMKAAIPRRVVKEGSEPSEPVATPIRGLGLARASGETDPVFELPEDTSQAVWVPADLWRSRGMAIMHLAKKIGVVDVYVASPTAESKCTDVRPLKKAVLAYYAKENVKLADVMHVSENNYYTSWAQLYTFGKTLLHTVKRADLYDRLQRVRGPLGEAFRLLRPFIASGHGEHDSTLRQAIQTLFADDRTALKPSDAFKKSFDAMCKSLNRNDRNITARFVSELNYAPQSSSDEAEKLTEALIALNRISPLKA